jgi:hypothetical protein
LGVPLIFYGIIYHTALWAKALIIIGAVISLAAVIGWGMEPVEEPHVADSRDEEDHADEAVELGRDG